MLNRCPPEPITSSGTPANTKNGPIFGSRPKKEAEADLYVLCAAERRSHKKKKNAREGEGIRKHACNITQHQNEKNRTELGEELLQYRYTVGHTTNKSGKNNTAMRRLEKTATRTNNKLRKLYALYRYTNKKYDQQTQEQHTQTKTCHGVHMFDLFTGPAGLENSGGPAGFSRCTEWTTMTWSTDGPSDPPEADGPCDLVRRAV